MAEAPQTTQPSHLDDLGLALMRKAEQQVILRQPIEDRWIEDIRQFNGQYDRDTAKTMEQDKTGASKIFTNLTRSKTTAAEARVADMLFPSDDRNWSIKPTPIPDLVSAGAAAQAERDTAIAAAKRMEHLVEDQLNESRYPIVARDVIHDAALVGAGIFKGPVVVNRERKAWQHINGGVHELTFQSVHRPAVERVDFWDFFPDMTARSWDDVEFTFERKRYTRKKIRQLKKRPGYLPGALDRVLATEPREKTTNNQHLQEVREITGMSQSDLDDNRYEFWEYHGPLTRESLVAAGLSKSLPAGTERDEFEGMVLFCNGIVVKVLLHPLDTEDSVYSMFVWEEDDATVFGFGVPYLMRSPQRVINAAWRGMLDNAALSVGPQVVVNSELVRPADGHYRLTSRKVWLLTDPSQPVNNVFGVFKIENYQKELMEIFMAGKRLADEETSLPMIAQGEQGEMPKEAAETATGMSMLMNAANVVLRRIIKRFDDDVTRPLITRFYDYNMQYADDPGIKGDFEVDARGSSALMVKETQAQSLAVLLQFGESPVYGPLTKTREVYRKFVEANRLDPDEVVKSEDELRSEQLRAQSMGAPPDPEQMKLQAQQAQTQAMLQDKERDRELKILDMTAKQQLAAQQAQARLEEAALKEKSKQDIAAAEMLLKQRMGQGI